MPEPIIKHYEMRAKNSVKLTVGPILGRDKNPKNLTGTAIRYVCEALEGNYPDIIRDNGSNGGVTVIDGPGGIAEAIVPKDKILGARHQTTRWRHYMVVDDGSDQLHVMEGIITVAA